MLRTYILGRFIVFALFFIPSFYGQSFAATCTGALGVSSCTCSTSRYCSGSGSTIRCYCTSATATNCGSWSSCRQDGAKCYQTRWCTSSSGGTTSTSYQISECACPSTGGGGGGTAPTPVPPTATPKPTATCFDSDGGSMPNAYGAVTITKPGASEVLKDTCLTLQVTRNSDGSSTSRWVSGTSGTHVGEKTCKSATSAEYADTVLACQYGCQSGACNNTNPTPTPIIYCNTNPKMLECPLGYTCVRQPMPTCPPGMMCKQVMPQSICIPDKCHLRSKGDANCDGVVNDLDYSIWKTNMQVPRVTVDGYFADFNKDGVVSIADFEIWRATRHN